MYRLRVGSIVLTILLITFISAGCAGTGRDPGSADSLKGGKGQSTLSANGGASGADVSTEDDDVAAVLQKKAESQNNSVKEGFSKTYEGAINIKENAESGIIKFAVSDAGDKVSNIEITFSNIKFSSVSGDKLTELDMESENVALNGVYDVKEGRLEIKQGDDIVIDGRLNGSKAEGTIHYVVNVTSGFNNEKMSCDLGTWDWTAEMKK